MKYLITIFILLTLAGWHHTYANQAMVAERWCCKDIVGADDRPCLVTIEQSQDNELMNLLLQATEKHEDKIKQMMEQMSDEELLSDAEKFTQQHDLEDPSLLLNEEEKAAVAQEARMFTEGFLEMARLGASFNIITVTGTEPQSALRTMAGFNRRWDFGQDFEEFAFIIEPDGDGMYYDFSGSSTAKPRQFFQCELLE